MNTRFSRLARHMFLTAVLGGSAAIAAEWPEYRGPTHDGVSTEQIAPWTSDPKVLWRLKIGNGLGTFAISGA